MKFRKRIERRTCMETNRAKDRNDLRDGIYEDGELGKILAMPDDDILEEARALGDDPELYAFYMRGWAKSKMTQPTRNYEGGKK